MAKKIIVLFKGDTLEDLNSASDLIEEVLDEAGVDYLDITVEE